MRERERIQRKEPTAQEQNKRRREKNENASPGEMCQVRVDDDQEAARRVAALVVGAKTAEFAKMNNYRNPPGSLWGRGGGGGSPLEGFYILVLFCVMRFNLNSASLHPKRISSRNNFFLNICFHFNYIFSHIIRLCD